MADKPSKLMLDECFEGEDERFLGELLKFNDYHLLLLFSQRWVADKRPWARAQIVRYLNTDMNLPGHEVVVKRMFKHFEAQDDLEMLPHFMVCFDRLVRRTRLQIQRYDWKRREYWRHETLTAQPNKTVVDQRGRVGEYVYMGIKRTYPLPDLLNSPNNKLFSHRTRNYLRRRVWRYFRRMAWNDGDKYLEGVATALQQYCDADFAMGENILDNWSLLHACYFHHNALEIGAVHVNLASGQALSSLTAKPYFPTLWQSELAGQLLVRLIINANSALIRLWAMELLRTDNPAAIEAIDVGQLIELLGHADTRVRQFATELFQHHPGLAKLPVERWLSLLEEASPSVLSALCDAMKQHVTPERLSSQEILRLCSAQPVAVAQMGFDLLKARHEQRPYSPQDLATLAGARCAALGGQTTTWALSTMGTPENYDADQVVEFFDSLHKTTRTAALDWLENEKSAGYNDPALWAKLIEAPFDDVKIRLVDCLASRATQQVATTQDISPIWSAVILGVHRGGRTKLKAVRQIAAAIDSDLSLAPRLLPVLTVAVRSIRGPERRSALSAVVGLAVKHEELKRQLAEQLPELQWIAPALEESI